MKATALTFGFEDSLVRRAQPAMARPVVEAGEDSVTGVAGIVLWGELLDRLGLVGECDRRDLRPIGPGGYTGGACYRALVETQLAGGEFLSDRSLLAGEANQRLRGGHVLASHTTLWRFCAGADLGRASKAAAVNRVVLGRAWAMGAGPPGGLLTIDPDATWVPTYGPGKEGSRFSYKHEVGMSPMVGVCGETGDVLALRARAGNAAPGRALGSFIDECVTAIPDAVRDDYQLWVRVDSAGYQTGVVEAAERHNAAFSVTAKQYPNVRDAIGVLVSGPATVWTRALGAEDAKGSEVAETIFRFADRDLRLIVRRQPTVTLDQLSFDDIGGFRFHAILTNIPPMLGTAADIEHHHRLRGGAPEEAIRQLKNDFGLCHAPLENFFGNWLWWHASALAYNVARWVRVLALPEAFATCRGKRLRLAFLNIAARVVRHAGRLTMRLHRAYAHSAAFIEALTRIRRLPVFA